MNEIKTPAQRAVTSQAWLDQTAAIIEAEYATERRECVRVMKETLDYLGGNSRGEPIKAQLRELIEKMEDK